MSGFTRMKNRFLLRALRKEEVENGNLPIPKSQKPFRDHARLGLGSARFPFNLGESEANAVLHHQTDSNKFLTRGISTTPHIEIAKKYARTTGKIIKINCKQLVAKGIIAYPVKEWVKNPDDILHPEDDEIILVIEDLKPFPKELIVGIIEANK